MPFKFWPAKPSICPIEFTLPTLRALKHILSRYTNFLWAFLKPLGIWGVFLGAALDGAAWALPVDVVVAVYVAQNHSRYIVYVFVAAAGSALGSLVIYAIGYAGGEELLRKRVSAERFEKLHEAFDKHPFWSLMLPAMLPPPTPFKMFVLAAAVAEMGIGHFLLAIFSGRAVRFLILGFLVIKFGPEIVHTLTRFFTHHSYWMIFAAAAAVAAWLGVRKRRRELSQN